MKKVVFLSIIFALCFSFASVEANNWSTYLHHEVEDGERLSNIAEKYGLESSEVIKFNEGVGHRSDVSAGDQLAIPRKSKVDLPDIEKLASRKEKLNRLEGLLKNIIAVRKKEGRTDIVNNLNQLMDRVEKMKRDTKAEIKESKEGEIVDLIKSAENWRDLSSYFLEEPTLDNFKHFCKRSKDMKGPETETKEVLSEDRESIETVEENITFYESLPRCDILLSDKSGYIFVESDESHKMDLLDSDTDEERKKKIEYNEKIEKVIENYDLYGFFWVGSTEASEKNPALYFKRCFDVDSSRNWMCRDFFSRHILVPKIDVLKLVNQFSE